MENTTTDFEKKIPHRGFCAICNHVQKIHFWVPDEMWKESIPEKYWLSPVCLNCFTDRADEKLLAWDKEIKFVMITSLASQIEVQTNVRATQFLEHRIIDCPSLFPCDCENECAVLRTTNNQQPTTK